MSRDINQYKIFNEIGKGSFGKVYKGVDKLTGEEVALKFIEKKYFFCLSEREKRSRDLKNLREENELLKKINHPNVIALKDVIETPKEIIIVTDYAGRDLSGVIEEVKRFSLDKVKDYSTQILHAMLYLNQNRIIHRDLKPQNILIKGNHIKLCDFGFAKKLSASNNFLQSMKGTPLYLAPEIVRETKYTEKVDIWSFGCIIYELFTGRTPYYANTYQKLAPLILYQQVQYPKEMPADLKELISSMLQKNPSARPDWKELKNHSFFKQHQVLKDKIQNGLKEVVSIQIPDKPYVPELRHFPENKENNKFPNREQELIESRVIQKLENQNELKSYQTEFNKIYSDLSANLIDGKQLRNDIIFLHKVKKVFHERSQLNHLITDQLLDTTINIIYILIKMKKNRNNNENNNQMIEDDDITRNDALVFGLLCLAKVEKNYELLEKELRLIGKLVKGAFNGIAINTEIDEQITQFVTQILLQNSTILPIQCIKMGLIVIGIMVNQAFSTLANSYMYFERVAEDNLLSKIAKIYRKEEKYGTVLELLKTIIHPVKEFKNMTGNNPHHNLPSKLERVFYTMKEEVAEALLKTDFISELNPLQVYGQKSAFITDYCQILLQCLQVSPLTRKQFLNHSYWPLLLHHKRLRPYLFAYNMIFLHHQNKNILSNQQITKYVQQSHENKLVNTSIVWMSYFKLKNKTESVATTKFKRNVIEKLSDFLFCDEGVKKNSCLEVYGVLHTTTKRFDQPLIQLFYNFVVQLKPQNYDEFKDLLQFIFRMFAKICNTNCPFKPNAKSLYLLMTLFTENQFITKNFIFEKSVQLFFYECISDFIKREDFEYFENDFAEKEVSTFMARLIHCLNFLHDAEENQSKTSNLSLNALNLTKEIQSAGLYRVMFIDGLTDEQFYEHIKYSQKVISKTKAMLDFVNFLGVKVIPMCKHFINIKFQSLLVEISLFTTSIAREHPQFNTNILEMGIIKKFKEWLMEQKYSELIKEKVLYLVGNLAKRSDFFFEEFETNSVMEAITVCLKNFSTNPKILKNTIYSIGNISFYTQKQNFFHIKRFYKQIEPMVPYFAKAFDLNDSYLRSNLISTVSNLVRYSSIFLSQLIKTGLIGNILKLACEGQIEQLVAGLIMSLVKKILPYDEFYQAFGVKELKLIYQRRQMFGGDGNETIRKIREVLAVRGELN